MATHENTEDESRTIVLREPFNRTIRVKVTKSLGERFDRIAATKTKTTPEVVREALVQYADAHEDQE